MLFRSTQPVGVRARMGAHRPDPRACEMGPLQELHRQAWVGAGQPPRGWGQGGALPPTRRGPLLALSPRGQALQGKQKSVVSTVPNPKWLRPSCNPIKVRLVYLSSSGLFITVQMAATLGSSAAPCQPPATRSLAQQNLGLHLHGAASGGLPGARGPVLPSPRSPPPNSAASARL